jgi:uncharacterized protein YbjT (DUF2867 family)
MPRPDAKLVAVLGATGLQGGAVTRRLLADGYRVRALTRNPSSGRAAALAAAGAEVRKADMFDSASLLDAFAGAGAVYSVQNHHISGYDGEIRQGRNVADAVKSTAVPHLVYASAGPGSRDAGVGSWDTKIAIADYARGLGVPMTILRPMAFMELMTEPKFYPAASVWHIMPKLMGERRPVVWLAVDDLAAIAAKAIAEPGRFLGRDIPLASDVRSIAEVREIWLEIANRPPPRFPMPRWLFERFSGKDETTMWTWLADHDVDLDTSPARAIHPQALTVRDWLTSKLAPANNPRTQEVTP